MQPPPPPPPTPVLIKEESITGRAATEGTRKTIPKKIYVICLVFAASCILTRALYYGFNRNGISEVKGAAGSTPGKVLNKLKTKSRVQAPRLPRTHHDTMAVWNGTQEVALDRKVFRISTRPPQGAELGSVNGQNPRTVFRGSNGKIPTYSNMTLPTMKNEKNTSIILAYIHPVLNPTPTVKMPDIQVITPQNKKRYHPLFPDKPNFKLSGPNITEKNLYNTIFRSSNVNKVVVGNNNFVDV